MAPRHADMIGRNGIQDSSIRFDDNTDDAFDPFNLLDDETDHAFDDFGDSFALDFDEVEFPEDAAAAVKTGTPSSKSRRSSTSGDRSSRRERSDRAGMEESSRRMNDSTGRMGDSSRMADDSTKRRPRMKDKTPKPSKGPSFPKNTSRRGSAGVSGRAASTKSLQSNRADSSRKLPGNKPRSASDHPSSSTARAKSRRSLLKEGSVRSLLPDASENDQDESQRQQPQLGRRASSRNLATNCASPRVPRATRRESAKPPSAARQDAAADARSRIRKEAALKREQALREEQQAKLAAQKAKLAARKEKTGDLLGKKLAKLDAMNGDSQTDHGDDDMDRSMISKGARERQSKQDISTSMHSSTHGTQRRRRRTHLSHNILVRNMNQIPGSKPSGMQGGNGELLYDQQEDESEGDIDELVEGTGEMSMSTSMVDNSMNSSMNSNAKKEAWQRRRERNILS